MKLTCLVDNAVQPGSGFWGEHGLAYLIETAGGLYAIPKEFQEQRTTC